MGLTEERPNATWQFSSDQAEEALGARNDFLIALQLQAKDRVDDFVAKMLFTELVANVVRHAPGPIKIALDVDGDDDSWLSVFDTGPQFEWQDTLPGDLRSKSGRGLFLISHYSQKVVVERPAAGGNVVRIKFSQSY